MMATATKPVGHTPGIYIAHQNLRGTGWYIRTTENRELAAVNQREAGIDSSECRANAHLFAAAPDLLSACENLMAMTNLRGSNSPLESQVRAAIAKATGQEPA